jgi:hypothetical protein
MSAAVSAYENLQRAIGLPTERAGSRFKTSSGRRQLEVYRGLSNRFG